MDLDTEKLLYLIEARSPIYNYKDKDHTNKIVIDMLWSEIASEMKCEVSACKSKWRSLRNSYARHLRDERIKPSSEKQRKKWYFADAMSFLKDFINQHRRIISSLDGLDFEENIDEIPQGDPLYTLNESTQSSTSTVNNTSISSKRRRTSVSEMEAGAMIEFLHSKTRDKPPKDANELFFKSVLADYEKLSSKRQRSFKLHMINKMNEMQEEEENEAINFVLSQKVEIN